MNPSRPLALALLVSSIQLGACSRDSAPTSSGSRPSVVPAATVPAASAASATHTAPIPSASAPLSAKKPAPSVKDALARADARCRPKKEAESNLEMKVQMSETVECLRRTMIADLDRVLLPVKTSSPARFRALMDEQATYNKHADALAFLAEELMWVDFSTGGRSDGTARGTGTMGCQGDALTERIAYAAALRAEDAETLAKRVHARRKAGDATRASVTRVRELATKRAMMPAATVPPGETAIEPAAFRELYAKADAVLDGAKALAKATCEGNAPLATALGGDAACRAAVETYYLGQCAVQEPLDAHAQ